VTRTAVPIVALVTHARHVPAIGAMTQHLVARMVPESPERISRDFDGRHERTVRTLFGL
jgi:hypothetical protein